MSYVLKSSKNPAVIVTFGDDNILQQIEGGNHEVLWANQCGYNNDQLRVACINIYREDPELYKKMFEYLYVNLSGQPHIMTPQKAKLIIYNQRLDHLDCELDKAIKKVAAIAKSRKKLIDENLGYLYL